MWHFLGSATTLRGSGGRECNRSLTSAMSPDLNTRLKASSSSQSRGYAAAESGEGWREDCAADLRRRKDTMRVNGGKGSEFVRDGEQTPERCVCVVLRRSSGIAKMTAWLRSKFLSF